jgi:hypothetical protein
VALLVSASTSYEGADGSLTDAKFLGYGSLAHAFFSIQPNGLFNLIVSQFSRVMLLSFSWATLFSGIFSIINIGSQKQMRRVLASRVIALVQNLHIWGDRSNIQNPTNPMSRETRPVLAPRSYSTVAPRHFRANPNPTFSQIAHMFRNWAIFINLFPIPFRKWSYFVVDFISQWHMRENSSRSACFSKTLLGVL